MTSPSDIGPVRRLDFVDALRGWAFLGVLLLHVSQAVPGLPDLVEAFTSQGARGVQLFYVASAFTLFLSMDLRRTRESRPYLAFFCRRFFRIAPLFWFAIFGYTLLYGFEARHWAPDGIGWPHVLLTASFLHGWHPETITSVVPGGWSIAVEMTFYLTIPFLFRKVRTPTAAIACLFASTVFALGAGWLTEFLLLPHYSADSHYLVSTFRFLWFPAQLPVFFVGITLYLLLKHRLLGSDGGENPDIRCDRALRMRAYLLLAGSLYLLGALAFGGYRFIPGYLLYGVALGMFAYALAIVPSSLFVNKVTRFLGMISYSGYLTHFAVLHWINHSMIGTPRGVEIMNAYPIPGLVALFATALLATSVVSTITYYAIEVPGIRFGKRFISKYVERADARQRVGRLSKLSQPHPN